jgi:hypothetical protein
LLNRFRLEGIALEVSHRAKRRLYGLAELAPLRDGVAPPRRPPRGREPGRPPLRQIEEEACAGPPPPLPPLTPLERRSFDYSGLEAAMAFADEAMRSARRLFVRLQQRAPDDSGSAGDGAEGGRDGAGSVDYINDSESHDVARP